MQGRSSSSGGTAIVLNGGSLTVGGDVQVAGGSRGAAAGGDYAIEVNGGDLTLEVGAILARGLKVTEGTVADYLPEGAAFVTADSDDTGRSWTANAGEYVPACYTESALVQDLAVVAHTHTISGSEPCACGYTCLHTAMDDNGYCPTCQTRFIAQVTAPDDTVTYYATSVRGENNWNGLTHAFYEAPTGSKVKLLTNTDLSNLDGAIIIPRSDPGAR